MLCSDLNQNRKILWGKIIDSKDPGAVVGESGLEQTSDFGEVQLIDLLNVFYQRPTK